MPRGVIESDEDFEPDKEEEEAYASDDYDHQYQTQAQLIPPPPETPQHTHTPLKVNIRVPRNYQPQHTPQDEQPPQQPVPKYEEHDGDVDAEGESEIDPDEQRNSNMVSTREMQPSEGDPRAGPRRSSRNANNSQHGGSSDHEPAIRVTSRGRLTNRVSYRESEHDDDDDDDPGPRRARSSRNGRATTSGKRPNTRARDHYDGDDGFLVEEPEERRRREKQQQQQQRDQRAARQASRAARAGRSPTKRRASNSSDDYHDEDNDDDEDASMGSPTASEPSPEQHRHDDELALGTTIDDSRPKRTTRGAARKANPAAAHDSDEDAGYRFRRRNAVNYRIPELMEGLPVDPKDRMGNRPKPRKVPPHVGFALPFGKRGAAADSDSDDFTRTPRRLNPASAGGGMISGGGGFHSDLAAAAGTPSNLGRVTGSSAAALADVDPLGVNQNVSFEDVGGLDEHIASLKEMTLLPLLYPELFQRFNVTPPRGVLFHGPPGTGKTLLARALAASSRSGGRTVSFFMRKGADCLSKWVGEAERQLRLLFDEARNSQPSIIFFDEIDGLAPVRSSKQDQIHASIVSTLLALMDGMDGRGQVIVIGATNRPDAIDPALRRPGRFDREFYFPLPNADAREKILRIHTRGWEGWSGADGGDETVKGLARLTKGYGGADLRALCTEAALNAVQRRYPQIYKSSDRLVVKPETVRVEPRDFMIAVKKMVPSSARSTATAAAPLPPQLVPLLQEPLDRIKRTLDKIIPQQVKRNVLEEAEWEDDAPGGEQGALDREMMLQSMETLRVHRPRLVIHGEAGLGQQYLGSAALHHLESFNVQSLDIGALMSDSTRTPEAAIVQLFVEAKRHQPSIIFIPSLVGWSAAMSDAARTTTRAMLDSIGPTDPVLLLAVVDGSWTSLPRDVRQWFGIGQESRIALSVPSTLQREAFFADLMKHLRRPPTEFPDAVKKRRRVLEILPVAPPLEPKKLTDAELRVLEENDLLIIAQLKNRLNPIMLELKRKHKRFTKAAELEYGCEADGTELLYIPPPRTYEEVYQPPTSPTPQRKSPVGELTAMSVDRDEIDLLGPRVQPVSVAQPAQEVGHEHLQAQPNGMVNGHDGDLALVPFAPTESAPAPAPAPEPLPAPHPAPDPPHPKLHFIDLERIHVAMFNSKYLTPSEFLQDLYKIVENTDWQRHDDLERWTRAQMMYTAAEVMIAEIEPGFVQECLRMVPRERKRREDWKRMRAEAKKAGQTLSSAAGAVGGVGGGGAGVTRTSARRSGLKPEVAMTDPSKLERSLKRQRESDAGSAGGQADEEGRENKRVRISGDEAEEETVALPDGGVAMEVDLVAGESSNAMLAPELSSGAPPPSIANGGLLNPLPVSPGPDPTLGAPSPVGADISMADDQPDRPKDPTPPPPAPVPRTPSPPPGPPPVFELSESLARAFEAKLAGHTGGLTVEQLEQLRAACFDCVWRHRAEWNRDATVHEMDGIVDEFLNDVGVDGQEFTET